MQPTDIKRIREKVRMVGESDTRGIVQGKIIIIIIIIIIIDCLLLVLSEI